ncbi:uncharacterized protein LOC136064919 [Quercus suber]|uniref:uncharacterized protein LOC136064919 n=1 Tax=Quercus suber TaxID=58331 RepID=UPI0032DE622B
MWDRRVLERLEFMVGSFSVSVRWKRVGDGFSWACSGVYGPTDNNARGLMWDELVGVQQCWNVPWCCIGDFNIVRFPSERSGNSCLTPAMDLFSEFIEDLNLIDLPLEGGRYTWSSGSDQPSMSRIDRVLVSHDWEEQYPNVVQRILPRPVLDHFPILVEVGGMARGKSPCRFENMWLKMDGFTDRVHFWWNRHSFSGTPSFVFAKKLKALKEDIIQWNRSEFGHVGRKKSQFLEALKLLDAKEGEFGLSAAESCERVVVRSEIEKLLSLEEISWRQKSRMLWIKEGDNNTKFFHKVANSHRRFNHLSILEVDGVIFEEESEVAAQLVSELDKGRRRGSIVIPEGKLQSGWRSFGVQLRKTIQPQIQNNGVKHRSATFKLVRMMEKVWRILGGFENKGKEAALDFQILKLCISWGGISGTDKH